MSRSQTVSRAAWLALAASAVFAGAACFAWLRWRPVAPVSDIETAALTVEREQLRGNDDQVRDSLRQRRETLRRLAWTRDSLAALRGAVGDQWQWRWDSADRATLVHAAPRREEWPRFVALLASLTSKPGLVLESVELRAEGTARKRQLATVRLGLRFILADASIGDAERAAPSRDPLPVARANSPAESRKVGPGPALRGPSASAEPPATGPTPLRSDPTLRGPGPESPPKP